MRSTTTRLGRYLAQQIRARGLTQADVARLAQQEMRRSRRDATCSAAAVSAWVHGSRIPDPEYLVALLRVLDVPQEHRRAWADAAGHGPLLDAVGAP